MFPNLFSNKTKRTCKNRDMVFIKIFDVNGEEKEKHTLTEDDWLDYFGILEAISKNMKVKSKLIKKEGFTSEEDEEMFKKIDETIAKVNNLVETAQNVSKVKVLCFEGTKKEEDFIEIKIFSKGKKTPEETYKLKYSDIEEYIKIANSITSKLDKIAGLNPLKWNKKKKKAGKELIKRIIRKIEKDLTKIEILILRG
jgi:hypothetical protein